VNKKYKLFLHRFFKITVIIKGIDGVLDVFASLVLFFSTSGFIANIIPFLFRKELIEDPKDVIVNYLLNISQNMLPDTRLFIIIYLAVHGLIKISLALALNSDNYRAFKISELVLILFVSYQAYRFCHTYSIILLIVTLLDIIIIFLIHFESKKLSHSSISRDMIIN
jgi:uncharacterized membrane protein